MDDFIDHMVCKDTGVIDLVLRAIDEGRFNNIEQFHHVAEIIKQGAIQARVWQTIETPRNL